MCQPRAGRGRLASPFCVGSRPWDWAPPKAASAGERSLRADTGEPGPGGAPPPLHPPGKHCPSRCQSHCHRCLSGMVTWGQGRV